jgi:hypothetical protein
MKLIYMVSTLQAMARRGEKEMDRANKIFNNNIVVQKEGLNYVVIK